MLSTGVKWLSAYSANVRRPVQLAEVPHRVAVGDSGAGMDGLVHSSKILVA